MNNLKTKVHTLDVSKLKTTSVVPKKLSDVVDNKVLKNTNFKTLKTEVNKLDKRIPHTITFIHINLHFQLH